VRGVTGPRLADLIVKAGTVYSMAGARATFRSSAVRGCWIMASAGEAGLDELHSAGTRSVDVGGLTLPPALFDPHEHRLDSAGEPGRRGTLQPHRLADIAGCATHLVAAAPDDLPSLVPEFALGGGRALHDPEGHGAEGGWV
jgi:predicted amidohydrolase YtcJ